MPAPVCSWDLSYSVFLYGEPPEYTGPVTRLAPLLNDQDVFWLN